MRRAIVIFALWALAAFSGLATKSDYLVSVATATAFLALWGQSWNLLSGLTGNISLGHSVFVAVAAYVTLLLFQDAGLSPLLGGVAGIAAAVLLAAVIGAATLRLKGPYFTLATLSAAAVVLSLILHYSELTGGPSGIAIPFAEVPVARPDEPMTDLLERMVAKEGHPALVLDDTGQLVGIVTESDLRRAVTLAGGRQPRENAR